MKLFWWFAFILFKLLGEGFYDVCPRCNHRHQMGAGGSKCFKDDNTGKIQEVAHSSPRTG